MKASTLLSYAPELIQAIGGELDLPDVKHLRLVCRILADALACIVLRKLKFEITRTNMECGVEMIKTLATVDSEHAACYSVQEISIGLLSPAYDSKYTTVGRFENGVWVVDPPPENPPEVTTAEEFLKSNLFAAIASLKSVHTVEWRTDERNQPVVHRSIIDALKALPNLRNIQIVFSKADVPLEADLLLGREKIVISTEQSTASQQEEIFDKLAKAIAHNPILTSLDVRGILHFRQPISNKAQSLHQLFKYYPSNKPPLCLRELRLRSMLTRLDHITLPHLAHLTTLHLDRINEPTEKASNSFFKRFGRDTSAGPSKETKQYGSSLEDIWNLLRIAGVHLQNITVTSISSSFLDYLSSYSGLVKLDLETSGFHDGNSSDAMAARFYDGRLNTHVRSLESLRIRASFEGRWCFGAHNVKTISSLTNLKSLCLSIRCTDLAVENDFTQDAIKHLIDMSLECMPNIQNIEVNSALLELDRNAFCGTGSLQYTQFVHKKMLESVHNYVAPPTCKRAVLPDLKVGFRTVFIGKCEYMKPDGDRAGNGQQPGGDVNSGAGAGRLRYVEKETPKYGKPHLLDFFQAKVNNRSLLRDYLMSTFLQASFAILKNMP
ncbi:hypothetical protein JR316_0012217 [Psilocybe cubensis]|uniref:Uncharacterized protein n=1 Tax=Psilocybe cubensis TaxID=181762 RepID=A0ACB8GIR6_PSICU|nr:hypothetical protein JR316_0012217 [Psilocybe cubensis]KAH9475106.1 hypothetical protein JR316_0012217 [Psilocybe cubensis]